MVQENHFEVVSKVMGEGFQTQKVSYVTTTEKPYRVVKKDYKYLPELQVIEQLQVNDDNPTIILLKSDNLNTSLFAASFIAKKLAAEVKLQGTDEFTMGFSKSEQTIANELMDSDLFDEELFKDLMQVVDEAFKQDDFDDEEWNEADEQFFDDDWVGNAFSLNSEKDKPIIMELKEHEIPVIGETEFLRRFIQESMQYFDQEAEDDAFSLLEQPQSVWYEKSPTVIVMLEDSNIDAWAIVMPFVTQHLIFIVNETLDFQAEYEKFYFVTDLQKVTFTNVSEEFLTQLVKKTVKEEGLVLQKGFQFTYLHEALRSMRGEKYRVLQDTIFVAKRLCSIAAKDKGVVSNELLRNLMPQKNRSNASSAQGLVGLTNAKKMLEKVMAKMKFNQMQRRKGGTSLPPHNVLMFLGNPGTAKTSFAKYMAQQLVMEKLIVKDRVAIVSKKDLIGEYVGQTTPKIAHLFHQYKGGIIFIDEAYSLYEGKNATPYAAEAMAELVLQIEENPETIVVFAGYPEDMRLFLERANTGLKSRISHTIYFEDYTPEEMVEIYVYFARQHQLQLRQMDMQKQLIIKFFKDNSHVRIEDGNGRLMRQIFNAILEEKVMQQPNDMVITVEHVKSGLQAYSHSVKPQQKTSNKSIGFMQ